jgi:hypothetical protein
MHVSKIRCDEKSEKICKIFWELNRALAVAAAFPASHCLLLAAYDPSVPPPLKCHFFFLRSQLILALINLFKQY